MIHRIVEGRGGTVEMQMELVVRYEYGAITPWATTTGDGLVLVAARDGLRLHSPVPLVERTTPPLHHSPCRTICVDRFHSPGSLQRRTRHSHWTASPLAITPGTSGTTGWDAAPTPAGGAIWSCARSSR